jgi:hypothetical protein
MGTAGSKGKQGAIKPANTYLFIACCYNRDVIITKMDFTEVIRDPDPSPILPGHCYE